MFFKCEGIRTFKAVLSRVVQILLANVDTTTMSLAAQSYKKRYLSSAKSVKHLT